MRRSDNKGFPEPDPEDQEGKGAEKSTGKAVKGPSRDKSERKDPTDKDIFTAREKRDFLRAIDDLRDLIFIRLGFYGGLRISEVRGLDIGDIILDQETVPVLHIREAKGGRSRYVLIDEATAQIMKVYIMEEGRTSGPVLPGNDSQGRVSVRGLHKRFKAVLDRSGITRINPSPHTLRHTHITLLLARGMSLEKVQAQAGHQDIRYTAIYEHLTYLDRSREYAEIMGE